MVFKRNLCMVVFIAFIFTATVWWLVEKFYVQSSLSSVFLKVYSITISGSINAVPFRPPLRAIFITYVVYSIHIQTAFTSNLIQLFTIPQYEPHVSTLEDLAVSNLSVVTSNDIYMSNRDAQHLNKMYSTIYERVKNASGKDLSKLLQYKNLNQCILLNSDRFISIQTAFQKKFYYFKDNRLTGNFWYAFGESGFSDTIIKLFKDNRHRYNFRSKTYSNQTVVITLKHVCSPFAIWGLGLFLALIILLLKIVNTFMRTQVKKTVP
ncbi:hypothetical protein FQR65_LT13474 [Abscondita terminalis]|nr:hypothetical protein FQR65_LT13474 [Abscondita terminalis]